MPTFYNRKGNCSRGMWRLEDLNSAMEAVQSARIGVNEAARQFKVPCTTLRRKLKSGGTKTNRLGPPAVLGDENEKKNVAHIIKMQNRGFAPTRSMVRSMAYHLAEQLKIKHSFNKENEKAGFDWLKSFLRRNPHLSVRKSEGVSLARGRNRLATQSKTEYVIARKGSKNVAAVTSGEKGETITVISCCNAEGTFIPPICIFKGKNMKKEYEDGMPPGAKVYMSEKSAYISATLFLRWLQSEFVSRKPKGPVVLILDGHASHCSSVEVLEYAEINDVILLCLPSHTTQFLQPLDRAFFKALKSHYNAACNSFLRTNPTRSINRLQFGKLLADAWEKAATVKNAVSAFRSTGIFPFNPDSIPDYAFLDKSGVTTGSANTEIDVFESYTDTNVNQSNTAVQPADKDTPTTNKKETPGKILDVISPVPSTSKVNEVRKRSRQLAQVLTSAENISKRKEFARKKAETLAKKERKAQLVQANEKKNQKR
nr:unnamed protein product [Callosobruchus analis]